jgi:Fe-S cluster assembly ATP-binding protein
MSTLELKAISVTAEDKSIIHDVSFSLSSGTISVLLGPNGSGKSTLVNALMGHPSYKVTNGALTLDGENILALPTEKKAQHGIFLSVQHTPKIGGVTLATFLHKVHVATTGDEVSVLEYYLQLRDLAKEFGIDDAFLDRPISAGLSGGEKKLSEALQLAVIKPKFAILDEIDSGVDIDAMKKVFGVITKLKEQGTGFLLISHHPSLLEYITPDQVLVMANGTLARTGGKELAATILKEGFCVGLECPLRSDCVASKS